MSILDQKPKSALKEGFGTKFGIGLVVALSLSLAAFQIRAPYTEDKIVITDPFEGHDGVFVIEPLMSHQREPQMEQVTKPLPQLPVNIVIGDPELQPGPEPIASLTFDPFAALPPEVVNEPEVPKSLPPTRMPEKMPEFPGGEQALMQYLAGTPYCDAARDAGYEGKISVQFVVGTDGSVSDIKLLNKIYPCLDQAVANRIKHMPNWEPGYMGKRAVPVIMVAPIRFTVH